MTLSGINGYGPTRPHQYHLKLFVTDWTPRCLFAYKNIKKICQEKLADRCRLEVVDILQEPEVARKEQIVAVPTLKQVSPRRERALVGDFSRESNVLKWLDVESK
jgi:circadian clock protein KaiB